MVSVDDLLPPEDPFRQVEREVNWNQVRETARPFYRPGGVGRPGLDPVVLVKLALVMAWRGLPSMRQTLRVAECDMAVRRFLGFGLTDGCRITRRSVGRRRSASLLRRCSISCSRRCSRPA